MTDQTRPAVTISRRSMCRALALSPAIALALSVVPSHAENLPMVDVEKTSGCGCCVAWIKHLEANGFSVRARNVSNGALTQSKIAAGLKPEQFSCHTAKVAGYVVEGHVPADDVKRLLSLKPDAAGLTVPDMPIGSPGMEFGDTRDPFDVLLVKRDGSTEVFASYNR